MVPNEKNDLVPVRSVTRMESLYNYWKLNAWTDKNHFSLPFMDHMFNRLAGKE